MRALSGLSKADTLRLAEIEHYVKTGKRPDGLQVTDEWVDQSMQFLAEEMRPLVEAWSELFDQNDRSSLVVLEAKKVYRLWRRKVEGEKMESAFRNLEKAIKEAEKVA